MSLRLAFAKFALPTPVFLLQILPKSYILTLWKIANLLSLKCIAFLMTHLSHQAIRDGVIDATIDHEQGFIQSKENLDVYATQEPRAALHRRITFCLNIHNDAVKVGFIKTYHSDCIRQCDLLQMLTSQSLYKLLVMQLKSLLRTMRIQWMSFKLP